MVEVLSCFLTNLFRIYLIDRLIQTFLGTPQEKEEKKLIVFWSYYVISTILFWRFHLIWLNTLSNMIGISSLIYMYTKSWKWNIFLTTCIYALNSACDIFLSLMFFEFEDGMEVKQIYAVGVVFLFLICEMIIEKIVQQRRSEKQVYSLALVGVPMVSLLLEVGLLYTKSMTQRGIAITALGLLCINFLMLYLYNITLKVLEQKYETRLLEQQCDSYRNQLQVIEEGEEKVKALRHDMKHHINELWLMAEKKKIGEIEDYIKSMDEFLYNPREVVNSGNLEIDSVINYMLKQAKTNLREVKADVQIPENLEHSFDVNIILGNLLENAIEAALHTEEKFLELEMKWKKGVLMINICNSFSNELYVKKIGKEIRLLSTKKDTMSHGIGLQNVKKIVDKYHGEMNITTDERKFYVKLILYIGS